MKTPDGKDANVPSKTSEEIKKALEYCQNCTFAECSKCAYNDKAFPGCSKKHLCNDALVLIERLEATVFEREQVGETLAWNNGTLIAKNKQLDAENIELLGEIDRLNAENTKQDKALAELSCTAGRLERERDQYKRERDAAVEMLHENTHCCESCKYLNTVGFCITRAKADKSCWEWRGAPEPPKE